ncbi:MAG: 6-bladed beta-propeller [Bacteroidales bacterium]|jgi:hypothetical protein|nr:6-bladed beta-propeller [Bacteroidales bacterium]
MRITLLILLSIFLFSCKNSKKELYKFDPRILEEKEISLSEIADDILYVPLDDSILISSINTVYPPKFTNDRIYLFDSNLGILVFSRSGQFLRKIGKMGRGPGEYAFVNTFTVDPESGTVYLVDLKSIKIYSKNGNYLRSFMINEYQGSVDEMEFFNKNLFVTFDLQYGDNFKYEWVFLDTFGNIINKKDRSIPIFKSNYLNGGGTFIQNSKLNFWHNFTDTIISISDDFTIEPNFLLAGGDFRLPKQYVDDPMKRLPEYMSMEQILETNQFLILRYLFYKGENSLVLIDKEKRESFLSYWSYDDYRGLLNDLDGGLRFQPRGYLFENGREYLIEFKDAIRFKTYVNSNDFENARSVDPEKKKIFKEVSDRLKETDNPVLVLVRLKK